MATGTARARACAYASWSCRNASPSAATVAPSVPTLRTRATWLGGGGGMSNLVRGEGRGVSD